METDIAICLETSPGQLKPILTARVTGLQVERLLQAAANLNDVASCLRVIIRDNLVRSIRLTATGNELRGIPTRSVTNWS